ncbi:Eco57I restriction-modification methylase domain-containing protein [Pilimelia columellifera]|uniref:site-specific DNA-methyltransferase (adenine-specific) n=1 Tax=Pilimelia columellifera subsp. columellifera TaxID=706583 RepID=A0ABP6B1Z3_9ACTN
MTTPAGLLDLAETERLAALGGLDARTQGTLGQFFTPAAASALVASLPRLPKSGSLRVLDPGAGSGMLTAALVARVLADRPDISVHVVAVECDESVLPHLRATLDACKAAGQGRITAEVIEADFILAATAHGADHRLTGFDLVIQNPPYGKLAITSPYRQAVKRTSVDAPNLYAAFLALSVGALQPAGQLVAITPRSFCNGPYFGEFRRYLLDHLALDHVHVFESRSKVFADTGVLQENVIFSGTREGRRDGVTLSVSSGHHDQVTTREVPYGDVVHPTDLHRFIRLTTNADDTSVAERMLALPRSLRDLGIEVSTGRVVDFRSRSALYTEDPGGAFPLIYPGNIHGGNLQWPRAIRKAQYFRPTEPKEKSLLLPEGWYTIVKRFSAKEERRRIVASVWSPSETPGPVAFENHLNVFHIKGDGLDEQIARGLSVWLNSSLVDRFFRTFSGHTQVNATDLRTLRFPQQDSLRRLGEHESPTDQADIDALVSDVAAGPA